MLLLPSFWSVACKLPFLFGGDTLHRGALMLVFQRRFDLADRLFEAAALRYRARLQVPALARLRVHQLIARAQACRDEDRDTAFELVVEIERRLRRLDDLQDLAPPFALISADDMAERWGTSEPEAVRTARAA